MASQTADTYAGTGRIGDPFPVGGRSQQEREISPVSISVTTPYYEELTSTSEVHAFDLLFQMAISIPATLPVTLHSFVILVFQIISNST